MLRVAIAGGGVGRVATANALLQRGISVDVYEQAPVLKEVGADVAIHPNGVRMLRRLGFGKRLQQIGARWTDAQFPTMGWQPHRAVVARRVRQSHRDLWHASRRSAADAPRSTSSDKAFHFVEPGARVVVPALAV